MNRQIKSIELQITRKCNMYCCYCSNDDGNSDTNQLTIYEYINIINQLPNLEKITLTGGEPSMSIDLLSRISKVAKDRNILLQLNTNGLCNDMKIWNRILSMFDIIHFSATNTMDKKLFTKIRGVKSDIFDIINNNIEYAHSCKSIKTAIEIIIGNFNIDEIDTLYEFYKDKVDEIQFQPLIINGRANPTMQVETQRLSMTINKILEKNTDNNVKLKLWCIPFLCQYITTKADNIKCECGLYSIYVTNDGLVIPCNVAFYPSSNRLNKISLKKYSITEILTNNQFYNHLHNNYDVDYVKKHGLCKMVAKNDVLY